MNTIRRYAAEDAHVIYGTAYDDTLGDQLRVTVIATGLSSVARRNGQGGNAPPLTVVQHAPRAGAQPAQGQPQGQGQPASQQPGQAHAQLRTGTDGVPILTQPVAMGGGQAAGAHGASLPPQHSYEGLNTPSVWRRPRAEQAAAKVDALVSNGMEEIEIPAFLRKQAD